MIKALLVASDSRNRDIIRTGLDQFQVFAVDHAADGWAVEMAREKDYPLIIVDLELTQRTDGMMVVRQIREFDQTAEIILVTRGRSSRLLSKEKAASNLFALLPLPLEPVSFFKLMARVRDRISNRK